MDQRTVIKYQTTQLTKQELSTIKEIIKQKEKLDELNNQLGLLSIGEHEAELAEIKAEEKRAEVQLLPSINFITSSEFKNLQNLVTTDTPIKCDVIICEFDYHINVESETSLVIDDNSSEEIDKRKLLRVNMTSEFGFFNNYETIEIEFTQTNLDTDMLKYEIEMRMTIYRSGGEEIEKAIKLIASDYDIIRFRMSAILFETTQITNQLDEDNYFNSKKSDLIYKISERVFVDVLHLKSGVPLTDSEIKKAEISNWNNTKITKYSNNFIYESDYSPDEKLYDAKNLRISTKNLIGTARVHSSCVTELQDNKTNMNSVEYYDTLSESYFQNYINKLTQIDNYIVEKLKSDAIYMLTSAYRDQLVEKYIEGDNNIITTLLQNDQAIRKFITTVPQPVGIRVDLETSAVGATFGMPVVRYAKSWSQNAQSRIVRLGINLDPFTISTQVENESIIWNSDFKGTSNQTITAFENDDFIFLITYTTFNGQDEYFGDVNERNLGVMVNYKRNDASTADVEVACFGNEVHYFVLPTPALRRPTVSLSSFTILVKGAVGHVGINSIALQTQLSIGNQKISWQLDNTSFIEIIQEYNGRLYYGYKAQIGINVRAEERDIYTYTYGYNKRFSVKSKLSDVGANFKNVEFNELEEDTGLKITYGAQKSTPTTVANATTIEVLPHARYYVYTNGESYVPTTQIKYKDLFNKNLEGGKQYIHDAVGDFGWAYIFEGKVDVTMLLPPDLSRDNIVINSEVIDLLTMSIVSLTNNYDQLKQEFDELKQKVDILWEAATGSNGDPFFTMFLNVISYTSIAGEIIGVGTQINDFRKGVKANLKYQDAARRATIGGSKTGKQYRSTKLDLDSVTLRERLLDSTLIAKSRSRHELYDLNTARDQKPHFLHGRYNEQKFDASEMLDLQTVAATGGIKKIEELSKLKNINSMGRNGPIDYDGPLPVFKVYSTPLYTLPQPLRDVIYPKTGIKLRRNNRKKVWEANTRRPYHTFGTFEEYSVVDGGVKPDLIKTTRYVGIGELNKQGRPGSDIGGFKFREKYVGYDETNQKRIWQLESFSESELTERELNGLYSLAFGGVNITKSNDEKWLEIVSHVQTRVLSSNNVLTYFPDPSFGKVIDDFLTLDIKYSLLSLNCQNLMINLINFSESGRNISTLSPSMQRSVMRARIRYYDDVIDQIINYMNERFAKLLK